MLRNYWYLSCVIREMGLSGSSNEYDDDLYVNGNLSEGIKNCLLMIDKDADSYNCSPSSLRFNLKLSKYDILKVIEQSMFLSFL